ncbi:MAG TPA: nucleoside deaminase [Terriglobales bacterium]|nr:nucleoside deaminase [Terriglobales bacterium]
MINDFCARNVSEKSYEQMLTVAISEARNGLSEGGLPIGAAIFRQDGSLVGSGHNRRLQNNDPSLHGETDAFRNAGRRRSYRDLIMVTTLAPCWYCSGLIRQFGFQTVVVGESRNFQGGLDWLRSLGVRIIDLDSEECASMMAEYIRRHPDIWNEDIGENEADV